MQKKILIIGKSCSGKTTFSFRFKQLGYRVGVFCTTRPKRHDEIDGLHYNFISKEEYDKMLQRGEFATSEIFNDWGYGLTKDEYLNSDVIVLTPSALKQLFNLIDTSPLSSVFRDAAVLRLYLNTRDDLIKDRMANRLDKKEADRRFLADTKDFEEFIANREWDLAIDYSVDDNFAAFFSFFEKKENYS